MACAQSAGTPPAGSVTPVTSSRPRSGSRPLTSRRVSAAGSTVTSVWTAPCLGHHQEARRRSRTDAVARPRTSSRSPAVRPGASGRPSRGNTTAAPDPSSTAPHAERVGQDVVEGGRRRVRLALALEQDRHGGERVLVQRVVPAELVQRVVECLAAVRRGGPADALGEELELVGLHHCGVTGPHRARAACGPRCCAESRHSLRRWWLRANRGSRRASVRRPRRPRV